MDGSTVTDQEKHTAATFFRACDVAVEAVRGMNLSARESEWWQLLRETAEEAWSRARFLHASMSVLDDEPVNDDALADDGHLLNTGDIAGPADIISSSADFADFLVLVRCQTPYWLAAETEQRIADAAAEAEHCSAKPARRGRER